MIADSNTLHVMLPQGMGLHAASSAFRRFGDVARLEALPSEVPSVTVSFFDVRAARRAMQRLGADYCWPGEQWGERTVVVPGSVQLSTADYARVSDVRRSAVDDGGYTVEFFDVRDAARVNGACTRPVQASYFAKVPTKFDRPEPAYITPSADMGPPAAARNEAAQQSVLIQGLPNALCSKSCMDAMLEQAGVQGAVVSHTTSLGNPCGEAVVHLVGRGMAERCVKHFQGRVWDPSGTPVTAKKLAPSPTLLSAKNLAPPPGLSKGADGTALVPPPGLGELYVTKEADMEESTDAGASEAEENQDEYLAEMSSAVV